MSNCGENRENWSDPSSMCPCFDCGKLIPSYLVDDSGISFVDGLPNRCEACADRADMSPMNYLLVYGDGVPRDACEYRQLVNSLERGHVCQDYYITKGGWNSCMKSEWAWDTWHTREPKEGELIPSTDCRQERYSCQGYNPTGIRFDIYAGHKDFLLGWQNVKLKSQIK